MSRSSPTVWLSALLWACPMGAIAGSGEADFASTVEAAVGNFRAPVRADMPQPPEVPGAAVYVAERKVSFLTYNAGLLRVKLPRWLKGGDKVPLVAERAQALPAKLADFLASNAIDVVLLEEVWEDVYGFAVTEVLEAAGYQTIRPRGRALIGKASGLILAVKQPLSIVKSTFVPFVTSAGAERLARKGIVAALIQEPAGQLFAVVGTHMQAMFTDQGQPIHKGEGRPGGTFRGDRREDRFQRDARLREGAGSPLRPLRGGCPGRPLPSPDLGIPRRRRPGRTLGVGQLPNLGLVVPVIIHPGRQLPLEHGLGALIRQGDFSAGRGAGLKRFLITWN